MQLDPQAKTHGPDIHLLDAKIAELLEESGKGDLGEQLKEIRQAWEAFREDNRKGRHMAASTLRLDQAIKEDRASTGQWDRILNTMEVRRKTLDSEQRRMKDHQQMIPTEEMLILVRYISESIKSAHAKYTDPLTARRIYGDISRDIQLCISRYAGSRTQFTE